MINAADKHRTVLVRVRTVVFHGNFVVLAGAFQNIKCRIAFSQYIGRFRKNDTIVRNIFFVLQLFV